MAAANLKPVVWIGSSVSDLRRSPEDVRDVIGFGLFEAQQGRMPRSSKPLQGFGSAGVLEIIAANERGTYRGVYTVKFGGVVYVLHVFQKRSTRGIATPRHEMDLIRSRLAAARSHYEEHRHEYEKLEIREKK
ncbi:MAG TPA: type II toxin-antitoxin system RelE/ParE family toxin [Tepidisphaeraceae bacterium]|nr:type II toxin-antitoxin system RelE/ParE family toxin [Tepidisphaeraceae bacterium]